MATVTRQLGRRGTNLPTNTTTNGLSSDSGVALSPSSTGSTSTPPRRYVLDVPSSRASRSARRSTTQYVDDRDERADQNRSPTDTVTYSTLVKTEVNDEMGGHLSRSGSREYYYRDGANESSTPGLVRYSDNDTVRQLVQTTTGYSNRYLEDDEVRELTSRSTPDIRQYPINADPNPELIVRPNTQRLTYTQDIAVRYLKPKTPPPPGPIIIREIRAPAPPPAPPIILRQRPPPPRTPSPVIIRERPPPRPKSVPTTVVKKVIPPPPPPPRKLIIERLPKLPPKPRPVIIERWLPYQQQKRQVILEKAKELEARAPVKNTIIEWRSPEVEIVKQVKKLGVQEADPERYYSQYGDRLYATDFVQRKLTELGLQEEIALINEQRRVASQEELAMTEEDENYVRGVLTNRTNSPRTGYQNNSVSHLVQANTSSYANEYDDHYRQNYYRHVSPSNSMMYGTVAYANEESMQHGDGSVLTEDLLIRSTESNNGKFPTHLLSRLGSQIYDMPSDHIEYNNAGRRTTTTTTTTNYYNFDQQETGYDSTAEEVIGTAPRYTQEKFIQLRTSDSTNNRPNYNGRLETREIVDD